MVITRWGRNLVLGLLTASSIGLVLAQGDLGNIEGAGRGDLSKLCTALGFASTALAKDDAHAAARAEEAAATEQLVSIWAEMLTETALETDVPVADLNAALLAAAMAQVEEEANPTAAGDAAPADEWTSFDIARTALSVASIADPTGATGVAAAYTYPVCGTDEALKSVGGFCWKHSDTRGVGEIPAHLGRVADCPAGQVNFGLTCSGGGDTLSAPSRVANCPEGFTNTGLSCLRPASTYSQASRMADCPAGYTNFGASCTRGADSYSKPCTFITKHECRAGYTDMGCHCQRWADTKGLSAMRCGAGEFRSGGRCYKHCRPGYTNNGETCGRGAESRSTASMSCPTGYFLNPQLGRCYKQCPQGYTNTGETCFRPVSTAGLEAMSCKPGEFFNAGRCYDQAACAASNGPNGPAVMDLGLCYPACQPGKTGIGPVCWTQCSGKLAMECAAGCAASATECALATTDMVASPLEMVASIVSLGGYSSAKSARKAATVAARQGVQAGAQRLAQGSLRDALSEAAQAGSEEAAQAAGRTLARRMASAAKTAADRATRTTRYIDAHYTAVRNRVLSVFTDAAKRGGKVISAKAKANWDKVKAVLLQGEPQRQAVKKAHPEWQAKFKKVFDEMLAVRKHAKSNTVVQAESLVRSCTKFGLKVDQAMLE